MKNEKYMLIKIFASSLCIGVYTHLCVAQKSGVMQPLAESRMSSAGKIIELSSNEQFMELKRSGVPYVLMFFSTNCGACKRAHPFVEKMAAKYPDVYFLSVTHQYHENLFLALAREYKINAYPSFIFINAQGQALSENGNTVLRGFDSEKIENNVHKLIASKTVMPAASVKSDALQKAITKQPVTAPVKAPVKTVAPSKQMAPAMQQKPQAPKGGLIHLQNESQLNGLGAHVLIFSTSWCGPCKQMKPIYEQLSFQYAPIPFFYVDGDQFQRLKTQHGVSGYPTVVMFAGSEKEVCAPNAYAKRSAQKTFKFSGSMGEDLVRRYFRNFFGR